MAHALQFHPRLAGRIVVEEVQVATARPCGVGQTSREPHRRYGVVDVGEHVCKTLHEDKM